MNGRGRRLSGWSLGLAAALVVAAGAVLYVAVRGPATPVTVQDRVREVASTLRCPVCQDLSAADSPSGVAQEMRRTIAADLRAGKSPDQIRSEFIGAYGEWILLSPPRHGVSLVAWIVPVLLLVGAVGLVVYAVRRWTTEGRSKGDVVGSGGGAGAEGEARSAALSAADQKLLERALAGLQEEPE